jgi:hypothetical protein
MCCRRLEKRKADMIIQARNKPKPGALQKQLDAERRKTDNENLRDIAQAKLDTRKAADQAELMRHN